MRMYDIINKKKAGKELSEQEIRFFINGYNAGDIPDYQAAAFCMAVYFKGMTDAETAYLTFAVRDSGEKISFPDIKGIRVDKHSTGGVGDKTSLIVAPAAAALGVKIAKISGRGLGHTGGTVDKLESIRGFNCNLGKEEFQRAVNQKGIAIVGQSADLAPADKKLYALRDVTATVDSMPLIASSIMGKKLALDDECIVLDVKCGSGSFMKTFEKSRELARLMVQIGKSAGRKTMALITDMNAPLGNAVGNTLEVVEAINTLKGQGPADLTQLCVALAANMLVLAGNADYSECENAVKRVLADGSALKKFRDMVEIQGGDVSWVDDTEKFPKARYRHDVTAPESGYVCSVDAEGYGLASLMLGAGRNKIEDKIDSTAGVVLAKKTGCKVEKGEIIATLYSSVVNDFTSARDKILSSVTISGSAPAPRPMVMDKIF